MADASGTEIGPAPVVTRRCKRCGGDKPLTGFPVNNTFPGGVLRKHTCAACRGHQAKVRRRLHRLHPRPAGDAACPICRRAGVLQLDHDHDTDAFRGWLCNDCNNGIGKFGDSIPVLERCIVYLRGARASS